MAKYFPLFLSAVCLQTTPLIAVMLKINNSHRSGSGECTVCLVFFCVWVCVCVCGVPQCLWGMDMWVYHTDLKPSLGSRLSIPKAINGSARCSPAWICSDKVWCGRCLITMENVTLLYVCVCIHMHINIHTDTVQKKKTNYNYSKFCWFNSRNLSVPCPPSSWDKELINMYI